MSASSRIPPRAFAWRLAFATGFVMQTEDRRRRAALLDAMEGHVLASGEILGMYRRGSADAGRGECSAQRPRP